MEFITASILSEDLGVSHATAARILKAVKGGTRIGNLMIYDRGTVIEALEEKNEKLLIFLGYKLSRNSRSDDCDCNVCPKCRESE